VQHQALAVLALALAAVRPAPLGALHQAQSARRSFSNSSPEPAAKIGQTCRSQADDAAMDRSTVASLCPLK
jgi:hypothetical protein